MKKAKNNLEFSGRSDVKRAGTPFARKRRDTSDHPDFSASEAADVESVNSLDPECVSNPDADDETCSTTAYTRSLATEEDFESFDTTDYPDNRNDGNETKSAITRSQFPGFGHDILYFPRDGERGLLTEMHES